MSCVNNRYSAAELESIFVWDMLCDALPLTVEERREINSRDRACTAAVEPQIVAVPAEPIDERKAMTVEERKRRKREQSCRWREANKERIRATDAAYRARERESINERQREYDRFKERRKKIADGDVCRQAQP